MFQSVVEVRQKDEFREKLQKPWQWTYHTLGFCLRQVGMVLNNIGIRFEVNNSYLLNQITAKNLATDASRHSSNKAMIPSGTEIVISDKHSPADSSSPSWCSDDLFRKQKHYLPIWLPSKNITWWEAQSIERVSLLNPPVLRWLMSMVAVALMMFPSGNLYLPHFYLTHPLPSALHIFISFNRMDVKACAYSLVWLSKSTVHFSSNVNWSESDVIKMAI